jgi:hypothetical protein
MKIFDVSYVQRCGVVSARASLVFLAYITLLVSPTVASIDADSQGSYRASSACLASASAWYEAWHKHFICQQGYTMTIRNDATQSSSNTVLKNGTWGRTTCSAQYNTGPELTTMPNRPKLQILIPLYIYPDLDIDNSLWKAVAEAQSKVDITAVINPHNGPLSDTSDPRYRDYQKGLQALRNAKVRILGYVPTNYAKREKQKIQEDIDTYIRHYDIDGIFFDEAANIAPYKDFYAQLAAYIRTKTKLTWVVLNPGVPTAPVYVDTQHSIADTVVTFEQTYAHWIKASGPPDWTYALTASRFALLVHTAPDISAMKRAIDLGTMRHYGYVYITNDMGANPWDTLPSYWQDMVHYIQQLNVE